MKVNLLLTTIRGVEDYAAREVSEITGKHAGKQWWGMLKLGNCSLDDIFLLNYTSKSIERVLLLLYHGEFEKIDDIYKAVVKIGFAELIDPKQSFAVRAQRHGYHDFTSLDVASVTGQAIIDSFLKETGKRLRVNLDEPDVIFRVYVRDNRVWFGLDTTGDDSLHKRGYRAYQHPAPLNPCIAHLLLRIAEWKGDESLIDPFCGGGTIPIEAGLYGMGIPNWFRDNYAFWKLKFINHERFVRLKERIDRNIKKAELMLSGCDLFKKHVEGARLNAASAGVPVNFFVGDATKVNLSYDKIVTNPPYGLRIARKGIIKDLYERFYKNLIKHEWKRAVVLTAEPEYFPRRWVRKIDIMYGNLPTSILVFEKTATR